MKRQASYALYFLGVCLTCIVFTSCRKKDAPLPVVAEPTVLIQNDPDLTCADLPPAPAAGWRDTMDLPDRQINAFFFNPLNPNQVILIVNGDLFGYNKMYNYDIVTKKLVYLGDNGDYLPHINKKGWIVFNRADLNVYKVKVNGDSLTQLTFNNISSDPKWDANGEMIYCYQTAVGSMSSLMVTMNASGGIYTTLPTELANTAVAHRQDKIAYLRSNVDRVSVYLKDLAVNSETFVVSVPANITTYQTVLAHLTFDKADENLYWSNDKGIFKYNIAQKKLDTVRKNCANITYARPVISNGNQLTFGCHIKNAISPSRVLHKYKALELDMNLSQLREVRVFH